MGYGGWDKDDFVTYSCSAGRSVNKATGAVYNTNLQDFYKQHSLHPELKPYKKVRECCDSDDHPATIPVILALDVTGSMGAACVKTAQKLGVDPYVALSIAKIESNFDAASKSAGGAIGLFQLNPSTAKKLGINKKCVFELLVRD